MNWQRRSKYHMTSGDWSISKAHVLGTTVYTLWHGKDMVSAHGSAEEAKKAAEDHEQ